MANYEALTQGLARVSVKASAGPKVYDGFTKKFFAGEIGTDQDVIRLSYEDYGVSIPEEAARGEDPTRVNYKTPFNESYIQGQYFFPEQEIKLSDAQRRLFEEPLDKPWSVEERELYLAAKVRDRMAKTFAYAKQKVVSDAVFTGKFTTKNGGEQSFPVTASNLALSGATLSTKPIEVLSKACLPLIKKGHMINTLLLNPEDAITLAAGTGWKSVLDTRNINTMLDTVGADADGFAYLGVIPSVGSGNLKVYAYYGTVDGSTYFIPKGKALLLGEPIGVMGYCGVLANVGGVQGQVAANEVYTVYGKDRGALVVTMIQGQTSPCPIITGIDNYGVLTSIS